MSVEDRVRKAVIRRMEPMSRRADEHTLLGSTVLLFAAVVFVDAAVVDIGLVRPVVVVPFLTVVPGYLLLRIIEVEPRDFTTGLLYAIGLSLVFLMLFGFVINSFYPVFGVDAVFTQWTLFVSLLVALCGLFGVHYVRNEPRELAVGEYVARLWQPWPLGLLCVPFLAILGARTVTRFGDNTLILSVLTLLGLITIGAYVGILPERVFPLAIWAIAISLLLHNSVLTHYQAWDAPIERRLAENVLANGIWDPTVGGKWKKNAMLRIVLLHPIYTILSGIDLIWEYKTVGPLLFSFAPVAFYKSYHVIVDKRDAFIAAVLAMSLFSFFTVLSWNSRTSGALLFLSLVALTITDRSLARKRNRILLGCFLFGIVVSHYGMAYITLVAIPMVLVGNWVFFGLRRTNKFATTTMIVAVFFGIVLLTWYIYIVRQAGGLHTLAVFSYEFFNDMLVDLLGESGGTVQDSVTAKYATTRYASRTIAWLQSLNLFIGVVATVGVTIPLLQRLRSRFLSQRIIGVDRIADTEYLLYATAFLGVFGITFVGVSRLNTARTLMPALLFFAPFVVVCPGWVFSRLGAFIDRRRVRNVAKTVTLAIVLVYFTLNVGLFGSVTGEYHPNILIDKDRVATEGTLAERKYFSAMYVHRIHDFQSEEWLETHQVAGIGYERLHSSRVVLGRYNCKGVSREPIVNQGTCADGPPFEEAEMHKVYATSGSLVFMNASVDGVGPR